ncbi:MAG: hypothetical protein M9965_01270 [Anaerolineae bacterium]|nr:hypothetical protein [Anaerolineae bacterium]
MNRHRLTILLILGLVLVGVIGLAAVATYINRRSQPTSEPIALTTPETTADALPAPLQSATTATPPPTATEIAAVVPSPTPAPTATLLPTLTPTETPRATAAATLTPTLALMPTVAVPLTTGQTVWFAQDDALFRSDPAGLTLDALTGPNFLGWNRNQDEPDFRNTFPQLSADGRWIAQLHDENTTLLFDIGTRQQTELPLGVWEVAWSPDNRTLAYVPLDEPNAVYLVDAVTAEERLLTQSREGNLSRVYNLLWSPDGSQLAFTCCFTERDPYEGISDGSAIVVDVATGQRERVGDAQLTVGSGASAICWTESGQLVAESDSAESDRCVDPFNFAHFSDTTADGRRAHWEAILDDDGVWQQSRLIVTDTATGENLWERLVESTSALHVAWSLDGNYLFFSGGSIFENGPIWRVSADNDDLTIFAERGTLLGVIAAWQRPGGAPTATPTPTPQPETVFAPVTPVVTAAYIPQQMAFSPDGTWLAYWASSTEDVANLLPATAPGGTLTLLDVETEAVCAEPDLHTTFGGEAALLWTTDDTLLVTIGDETVAVTPCANEPHESAELPPSADPPDPTLSADGAYRVETDFIVAEDGIRQYETRLVDTATDAVLAETAWLIDERLGDYSAWLGGEWVSPTQFVIYETLTQGPLLLDADAGVISVLVDLLGMGVDEIPSLLNEEGYNLAVRPIPGDTTDAYRLITYGVGNEGNFPPTQLYHAATNTVETLPYTHMWWTPVVGEWLIADARPIVDGNEQYQLWRRRIDDVDGTWELLADNVDATLFAADDDQFFWTHDEDKVVWQSFGDDLEIFGRYDASPYWVTPVLFSAEGDIIVAIGNRPGQQDYGLFILHSDQFES